jgi:hypothetical protein
VSGSIQEDWEAVADDPDPNSDLGYELQPLTVFNIDEAGRKYVFLPGDEEHLEDEEFVVAESGSVCLLDDCR